MAKTDIIDDLADEFESAWATGTPRIEDYLPKVPDRLVAVLLEELLKVEFEILERQGKTPQWDMYQERFAKYGAVVNRAIATRAPPTVPHVPNSPSHDRQAPVTRTLLIFIGNEEGIFPFRGDTLTVTQKLHEVVALPLIALGALRGVPNPTPDVHEYLLYSWSITTLLHDQNVADVPEPGIVLAVKTSFSDSIAGPLSLKNLILQTERKDIRTCLDSFLAQSLSHDPQAPLRFSDYLLEEELGRGGMGIVFRAKQQSLPRQVAVKTLLNQDAESKKRFRREACAIASLGSHANIVPVHGFGTIPQGKYDFGNIREDTYFLAMEFIKGSDLAKLIRTNGIPVDRAVQILVAIADAIQHAHNQGVWHRDLKPNNVLIDDAGRVLVTDFGLAKVVGGAGDSESLSGQVVGTPSYMPPEQADRKRGEVGPWSDVYGLGGILYALLVGQPPYSGDTAWACIAKVLSETYPPSPRNLRGDVPEPIDVICMKCLSKRPEDRYASALALKEALQSWDSSSRANVPVQPLTRLERLVLLELLSLYKIDTGAVVSPINLIKALKIDEATGELVLNSLREKRLLLVYEDASRQLLRLSSLGVQQAFELDNESKLPARAKRNSMDGAQDALEPAPNFQEVIAEINAELLEFVGELILSNGLDRATVQRKAAERGVSEQLVDDVFEVLVKINVLTRSQGTLGYTSQGLGGLPRIIDQIRPLARARKSAVFHT